MLLRVTAMDYQRCKNFFLHAFVGLPCLYLDTTKTLFTKTKKRFPTVECCSATKFRQLLRLGPAMVRLWNRTAVEKWGRRRHETAPQRLDVSCSQRREGGWLEATKCLNRNAVELGASRVGGVRAARGSSAPSRASSSACRRFGVALHDVVLLLLLLLLLSYCARGLLLLFP